MAAIAVAESNGDPAAVGDGGESLGAFQVQEKHWMKAFGPVPVSPVQQALQAEKILDELVASHARGNLRRGLAHYNGGVKPPRISFDRADRVMKLAKEVR